MGWWQSERGKGLTILLTQRQSVLLSMKVFCSLVLKTGIRLSSKNVFAKHSYLGIAPVLCLKSIHTSATKRSHVQLLTYLLFYMFEHFAYICLYITNMPGACGGQKTALDHLELKLKMVLGIEPQSPVKIASTLNYRDLSRHLLFTAHQSCLKHDH